MLCSGIDSYHSKHLILKHIHLYVREELEILGLLVFLFLKNIF